MKKGLSILIIVLISIVSINFTYGEEYNKLKPYEERIKHNPMLYNLYKENGIDLRDHTFTTKDNHKITINGIAADKGQTIFLYSIEGEDKDKISVHCDSFYLRKDGYMSFTADMNTEGNKAYYVAKYLAKLVPNNDNTITFSICKYGEGHDGYIEQFSIPFKDTDFLETYGDYDKSISLDKDYEISRIYSSSLGVVMNIRSKKPVHNENDKKSLNMENYYVSTKNGEIYPNNRSNYFIYDGIEVYANTYDSIPKDTEVIYIHIDNMKYVINLKSKEYKRLNL